MLLNASERRNLILHMLSKEKSIDGYSKFYSMFYLLKNDYKDAFEHYEFNSSFLTVKDKALDDDLSGLLLNQLATNDEVSLKLSHKHKIEISKKGENHLKVRHIEKALKSKLGKDELKEIDTAIAKYNAMSIKEVMNLAKSKADTSS